MKIEGIHALSVSRGHFVPPPATFRVKKMINQKCQNYNLQDDLVRTFWGVSHSEYTAQYSRHKLKIVLLQSLSWPFMLLQHGGGVASLGPQ